MHKKSCSAFGLHTRAHYEELGLGIRVFCWPYLLFTFSPRSFFRLFFEAKAEWYKEDDYIS